MNFVQYRSLDVSRNWYRTSLSHNRLFRVTDTKEYFELLKQAKNQFVKVIQDFSRVPGQHFFNRSENKILFKKIF